MSSIKFESHLPNESGREGDIDINNRAQLRKLLAEEHKVVAASISQAAKADAQKGTAVKTQRATFDSLLNTRIRLQKALIAVNSFPLAEGAKASDLCSAIQGAESAALSLWDTIDSIRSTIESARTGQKRKRCSPEISASPQAIWDCMQSLEDTSRPHRDSILQKWNVKASNTTVQLQARRLDTSARQTITDILQTHLSDSTRLVKRTHVPRSCAPLQASSNTQEDLSIYDDADFYGLLLKELLEQRSSSTATAAALDGVDVFTNWQASREAKTKRAVDTKASKGRKIRYTVHEKLQNFMAPEDRGTWGERQVDELFDSLFGRKLRLAEDVEEGNDEEEIDARMLYGV